MLVALYLGVNYIKGKDVFGNERTYYALVDNSGGLKNTAPVLLRGVKIGSVTEIVLDRERPGKVRLALNIKKRVPIPVDSRFAIVSTGLMGEKAVSLTPGVSEKVLGKNAVVEAQVEEGLLEAASGSVGTLVDEAKVVLASLNVTATRLNTILEQNTTGINGIVSNIETVSHQLASAELDRTLRDLGEFSTMLKNNTGRFENIVGNLDRVAGDIAEADLRATLDTLGMSIGRLNGMFARISDGDGTVSRLLDDPALYDSLTLATGNLATLLEDLKANPERYVQFSMFGRKEKKEKK
jgi:phospholipid/cholesterol/gamma-HCH transport system substrate-binding protein